MATKAEGATGRQSYEDFEPLCKWQKDEEHDTLEVHLHGFKKGQMRVQINNLGVLTISGSRPLDETRWSRFHKEIKVLKDCKPNEIHAKFSKGILHVVMPKGSSEDHAITKTNTTHDKDKPKPAQMNPENVTKESMARDQLNAAGASTSISGDIENDNRLDDNKTMMNSFKERISRLTRGKPMIVGVAVVVAVAAVVLLGIYVMNKYQAPDHVQD
ncbi:hypothetical protein HS088_TW15G00663 [Tripterygium wilfordii]|uniref:SHSP domain-containing protein n=1 Tax=Tripterygium wilfordii TaxID=458696 RepID=A0A7J7CM61_TRIWF|nr:inactive protein RESTRICTED TEV MOVEMENT 2-like [Tripterygium wilfordii]KAF5735163.1 hypothetical protein HS088_TW15G00663 [Tripterygium wilfordii]